MHNEELAAALAEADLVWMFRPQGMDAQFDAALETLGDRLRVFEDYDKMVTNLSGIIKLQDLSCQSGIISNNAIYHNCPSSSYQICLDPALHQNLASSRDRITTDSPGNGHGFSS